MLGLHASECWKDPDPTIERESIWGIGLEEGVLAPQANSGSSFMSFAARLLNIWLASALGISAACKQIQQWAQFSGVGQRGGLMLVSKLVESFVLNIYYTAFT